MNRRVLAAFAAVLLLLGGWYFASPFWAVRQFRDAALSGDADGLSARVDFPSVRDSLKSQFTAALTARVRDDPGLKGNPFAALGLLMMPVIVDKAIEAYVTPDGLAAMVKQGRLVRRGTSAPAEQDARFHYAYRGLDRFAVRVERPRTRPGEAPSLVFERRGLFAWTLVRLELPAEALGRR